MRGSAKAVAAMTAEKSVSVSRWPKTSVNAAPTSTPPTDPMRTIAWYEPITNPRFASVASVNTVQNPPRRRADQHSPQPILASSSMANVVV